MSQNISNRLALGIGIVVTGFFLLLSVAMLFGLVYGVWRFAYALPELLKGANSEIVAAIIVTSGTIIVAIVAQAGERLYSRRKNAEESHRPKKIECYTKFFETVIQYTQDYGKSSDPLVLAKQEEDLINFFREFTRDAILWSSPSVMKAYKTFATTISQDPEKGLLQMDALLQEIRKDVGHSNKGLQRGDLIKMFLSNPSELDEIMRKHPR